jgi:23S rRNA pseudouridine1911/1915/1917 synthase
MSFSRQKIRVDKPSHLIGLLRKSLNISNGQAQRIVDKNRVFMDNKVIRDKSTLIDRDIEVLVFLPNQNTMLPIYETDDFAVFDKPSGMLVHPKNLSTPHTLLDEARSLFGRDSCLIHRIDRETSGLVMVSKNKSAEKELKNLFADRKVQKSYIALVNGNIIKEYIIDKSIEYSDSFRVYCRDGGKNSLTTIIPIKNYKNFTLIEAIPHTGRLHQIRVHLESIGHSIVGDPIYGQNFDVSKAFVEEKLSIEERVSITGHTRTLLHSNKIDIEYKNTKHLIKSKNEILKEIEDLLSTQ